VEIKVCALVNNIGILIGNLMTSRIDGNLEFVMNSTNATEGMNKLFDKCSKADVVTMVHQDVILPFDWTGKTEKLLNDLPADWGVAGIWGTRLVDGKQAPIGRIADTRLSKLSPDGHVWNGQMPCRVDSLDEVCLIFNMKTGFRFEEELKGFDLYGAYACLRMREMGYEAYVIDNAVMHNTSRPMKWAPDEKFLASWEWLKERFPGQDIISTVHDGSFNERKE